MCCVLQTHGSRPGLLLKYVALEANTHPFQIKHIFGEGIELKMSNTGRGSLCYFFIFLYGDFITWEKKSFPIFFLWPLDFLVIEQPCMLKSFGF